VQVQTRYREAAEEFARKAAERFPEVEAVILYGSVARGEATDDSDVDLMVIATRADREFENAIFELKLEVDDLFEYVLTQVIVDDVQDFRRRAMEGYPLQRTVARQGVVLFDRGVFATIRDALPPRVAEDNADYRPSSRLIEDHLAAADQALRDAGVLMDTQSWDAVSNRTYYAMFNAATAAVLLTGVEDIRSHRALIALFRQRLAMERDLGLEYAVELDTAFQLRMKADYEPGFHLDETTASSALQTAERFIARMREFLAR